jgi:bifunctional DNA-binding transcriptional regulator/antitoxin component of YhaV-PrlF toxin-antitoxin module
MPLTQRVEFKGRLQARNQVQIPKLIRERYQLEPSQILKVTVCCPSIWDSREEYLIKMGKDGRITIPKLALALLLHNKPNKESYPLKVTLEPS